jgi:transcriptional regulator with PAS, ATPase and Fis domain
MLGEHALMLRLFDAVSRAAPLEGPVLIEGETGTGKELVAQALHTQARRRGAFVAINVATLTEGLAEAELFGATKGSYTGATADRRGLLHEAAGGTLLLDEAGDIAPQLQAKLLRVLEGGVVRRVGETTDSPIRFRLVVSVQESPIDLVSSGRWRADFYFRVAGIALRLPPLRERATDVPLLTNHFLSAFGRPALDGGDVADFAAQTWPGNVRQLRRAVERAVFDCADRPVGLRDILDRALAMSSPADHASTLRAAQARHIGEVLRAVGYDIRAAAAQLGLSRSQLYRKIRTFGIPLAPAG